MNETYYADARLSATEIKAFALGGPFALRHARDEKDSPALKLGRAIHAAVLTPEDFHAHYAAQQFDGRTKEGKAEKANAEEQGITLLSQEDFNACVRAEDLLPALQLLETEKEYYTDSLKCKIDGYDRKMARLVEFKTISDIFSAEKDFWARAYDLQLGHYANVLAANGVPVDSCEIVFFSPSQNMSTFIEIAPEQLAEFQERATLFANKALAVKSQDEKMDMAVLPSAGLGPRPDWVANKEDVFLL